MQRMTISGAFGAMFDFIRTSWHIVVGSMLVTVLVAAAAAALLIGGNMDALASSDPSMAMGVIGGLFLVMLIAAVFYQAGSFLSWRHGLTGGSEPVLSNLGWALGASLLSLLTMLVVGIVIYIVLAIVAVVIFAILGLGGGLAGGLMSADAGMAGAGAGVIIGIVLFYIGFLVAFYWIYGRFIASGPVMAVRRTVNPITGLGESWRLTGPSQWTILGFLILMAIISFVAVLLLSLVSGGVLAGVAAGAGSGSDPDAAMGIGSIVVAVLVYVPSLIIAVAMPAAVYRQVSDGDMQTGEIFA